MNQSKLRRTLPLLVLTVVLLAFMIAIAPASAEKGGGTVDVQILAVNDFHGNLQPPSGSSGRVQTSPIGVTPVVTVDAGGVEYLATHIANLRATNSRNTVVVSAGDMIGASPLISALFHDEPTIEAFSAIGLDFNAVGNHEFDEGITELLRMQSGGCHPVDGCQDGDGFGGADFEYLAANVVYDSNGKTIFPAYKVKVFDGVRVAFIGMTLEGTPLIVSPSGISTLDFLDEADTVNALVPRLKQMGIETIVVMIHEGGFPTGLYNECPGISGPIVDIVNRTSDEVDLFITGHTHQAYNCVIDDRPVTSAMSFGRIITDIDLTLQRTTKEPVSIAINNVIATRTVAKDPTMTALVTKYVDLSAPLANRIVGSISADLIGNGGGTPPQYFPTLAGEWALGDVIADAQLDATDDPGFGDAVVAFMNPGGIRGNLFYNQISGVELPGQVTYGEMFTVQPFGNSMVTMTLTGAQIERLLEEQFATCTFGSNRILQVSAGFTYTWKASGVVCDKVDPATIMLNGVVINPTADYRVTVNSFLADGGDSFPILVQGTDRLGGAVDTDAFEAYFAANSPVPPGPQNRITRVP